MPSKKKPVARRAKPKRLTLAERPYSIEDGVTQSLLTQFCNCRVACRYSLLGWKVLLLNEALAYGSFFHDLLKLLYNGIRAGTVTQESAPGLFWPFADAWIKDCQTWATAPDIQKAELIVAKAAAVWEPYCIHWAADFEPSKWLAVESTFDVMFNGTRLRGRTDGVHIITPKRARKASPWNLWVLETKTAGQVKSSIDKTLALSFQNKFYLKALGLSVAPEVGGKLKGVLQNIVRRPSHKPKQTESLSDYTKRVRALVEKDPKHFFIRSEVVYPKEVMARFDEELQTKLDLFNAWVTAGMSPSYRNTRACAPASTCDFLDACSSNGGKTGYRFDGRLFEELED